MTSDYKKYLPSKPQYKLEFELTNTVSDFANFIRRYIIEELNIYSMNVDSDVIITTDRFILNDIVKNKIELVPFRQDFINEPKTNKPENLEITLSVENNTDEIITVYSGDINIYNINKKN